MEVWAPGVNAATVIYTAMQLLCSTAAFNFQKDFKEAILQFNKLELTKPALSPLEVAMFGCHAICEIEGADCRGYISRVEFCQLLRPRSLTPSPLSFPECNVFLMYLFNLKLPFTLIFILELTIQAILQLIHIEFQKPSKLNFTFLISSNPITSGRGVSFSS